MKILFNIAGTYNSGGMERVISNKANWLVTKGYDVVIVTTEQENHKSFFYYNEKVRHYDIGINYKNNNNQSILHKLIDYPFKQKRHKCALNKLINEEKPNIIISTFGNEVSIINDIKDGSRKVLEIHFSKFKRLQYGRKGLWRLADLLRTKMDEWTVRKFDRFVVLTHEDKGYWGNLPNMCVIPNARTFSVEEPAQLDAKKVVAVGRLNHQKGFERLIAAWAIIHHKEPEWKLDIVGEGECKEELERQIAALGLDHCIALVPATTDMVSVYKNASILAMSSRYEGLPMVLLEAQAAGLPIVSFACKCGPKDVITDGVDGFLVEEGNIEQLAQKLLTLMQDADLRKQMGAAAYAHSDRYSEERIMKQWIDLFEGLAITL